MVSQNEKHTLRVFESRVLSKIHETKTEEVTGEWRKLHNEKHYDLYSSPNVILLIKSGIMRWVEHVTRVGKRRCAYRGLVRKLEG